MSTYIGVDPGKEGGVACWEPLIKRVTLIPISGPKKRGGHYHIQQVVGDLVCLPEPTNITIEEVGPRSGEGVVSVATFARCHGLLLGHVHMLVALHWKATEILRPTPGAWKKVVLAGVMRGDKGERGRFAQLTQGHHVDGPRTPHTQDALLLAAYGAMADGFPVPSAV